MSSSLRSRVPVPLRRALGAVRRRIDYLIRALLTNSFRFSVDILRALHILPRPSKHSGILIIHLTSHLGDTILMMPLIEALRAAHPDARIEVATESAAAPLLLRMQEVDHVYALSLNREPPITTLQSIRRVIEVSEAYWRQMRSCAPQICLMPRWDNDQYRSNALAYLVGAPRRIGFTWDSLAGIRPAPYRDRLLTEAFRGANGLHEAARFCWLATEAGLVPLQESAVIDPVPALKQIAATVDWPALSQRLGIDRTHPFAVIAPGASMPRKMWPTENWVHLCELLAARGFSLVFLSGPSDTAVAAKLYEAIGRTGVLAAGKTNLIESTTLLAHASLFLGSDSGPGHVAGALGVPTVVLFGAGPGCDPDNPAAPTRLHPLGPFVEYCSPPRNMPPCNGPCDGTDTHCIALIEPDVVIKAVDSVLARAEDNRASMTGSQSISLAQVSLAQDKPLAR